MPASSPSFWIRGGSSSFPSPFPSFFFNVQEIDGHNFKEIEESLCSLVPGKPNIIIANTIKGKGVSFMEDKLEWHYKSPNKEEYEIALKELK